MSDLETKINEKENLIRQIFYGVNSKDNGPLPWCKIQNNSYDKLLNIFEINSFDEFKERLLETLNKIKSTDKRQEVSKYITRRLLVYNFSQVDEMLFQKYGAEPNPIKKSKDWDFIAHGIKFDLKCSRVFKDESELISKIIANKADYIDFHSLGERMYTDQSGYTKKNGRFSLNNRLFLLHVSKNDSKNIDGDDRVRLMFDVKEKAIKHFMKLKYPSLHKLKIDGTEITFTFLVIYEDFDHKMHYYNA